jgi:putative transposase
MLSEDAVFNGRLKLKPLYVSEFGEGERLWQPRYYSVEIFSRRKLEEKLQYMHLNPVRKGYVRKASDWKWSSARWYERQQTVGIPIEWVECY